MCYNYDDCNSSDDYYKLLINSQFSENLLNIFNDKAKKLIIKN